MPINRQGSLPTNLDNGPAQELRDRERREPRGRQSPDGDTPSPQRRKIPHGGSIITLYSLQGHCMSIILLY